ncbi:MAG: hypothetical protein JSS91_04910 [Bacteroidetes bacterium]|nr:hypothetical protein [Bacteroidota bacterium]
MSAFPTSPVTSVGWRWNNPDGAGAPVAQSVATTGNLRVYMKDTVGTATTIGGNFIDTLGSGYTKVIDGTISIPATASEIFIDVPVGGPGTSPYIPTPGSAVIIIFVYKTTTSLATPLGSPTTSTVNFPAGSLLTYQSQTAGGSTGTSSSFRPETRLGTALLDVYAVSNIYGLGKVPTPWGCPDTVCYRLQRFINSALPVNMRIRIINKRRIPEMLNLIRHFLLIPVLVHRLILYYHGSDHGIIRD